MVCKAFSAALCGIDAVTVQAEADVRNGLPAFQLVGALAAEAKEAKERVRVAIENAGFRLPPKHITINLSPADIRKEGTAFDLPIAISVLAAFGYVSKEKLKNCILAGELSLDGRLNPVRGVLPMACLAKEAGFAQMLVPAQNAAEASVAEGLSVYGVRTLKEAVDFFNEEDADRPAVSHLPQEGGNKRGQCGRKPPDFSDIIGQEAAKRALTIAASGGHHLLMIGPPGSGKTALARCMPSILPELEFSQQLELSKIYSVLGKLEQGEYLIKERPFLAPHHAATAVALIGGGRNSAPGIVSLCHHGVLFLDELPQFKQEVLESLRQPLEEHMVTVSRLHASYTYPASFQLIAAMNPCLCGAYPDREKCRCTTQQIRQYIGKISQPILDRIDMAIEVFPIEYERLRKEGKGESSANIKKRVCAARECQKKRFEKSRVSCNAEMARKEMEQFCRLDEKGEQLLKQLYAEEETSTRGYYRLLRLARTIADLEGSGKIQKEHLAEAYCYRSLGKKYWH